jgi:hypothetical protein
VMLLHQAYLMAILKKRIKDVSKYPSMKLYERYLYHELLHRVPVRHMWSIENLKRDLNIPIE